MQIHFMISPLEVTPLDQTFEHFSRDKKLFFLFLVQLDKFFQVTIFDILEGSQPTVGTSVIYLIEMALAQNLLASETGDRLFDPFQADDAHILALESWL